MNSQTTPCVSSQSPMHSKWRLLLACAFLGTMSFAGRTLASPPTIVLMMADDLGFSDIGCYGSEIPTPNLDSLAHSSTIFTNFSNTSRCCPSRASLMTGRYSHQAGIGDMNYSDKGPGYRGQLLADVPTLPELLKLQGYETAMVGKWHLTRSGTIDHGPNGSWPLQRGFDRFFGSMEGAKNYFRPTWLYDQAEEVVSFDKNFFYTDAVSTEAADWIRTRKKDKPLFLYAAFYAPHFPLQAPKNVIDRHLGKYMVGWDQLRENRFAKQKTLGIVPANVRLLPRPNDVPEWNTLNKQQQESLDLRMATYAAQVEMLDQGVGRILKSLRETDRLDNTIVIFLSDNGGAAPGGAMGAGPTRTVGSPEAPVKTTYGSGWATVSNTPYRMHKANTHEGGVMSPLLVHWPKRLGKSQVIRDDIVHITDITPTIVSAAGHGSSDHGFSGIDLLSTMRTEADPVFYEHEKSRAVRLGKWKLVNRGKSRQWELYNLQNDRTELNDLASADPKRVELLEKMWLDWAERNHVKTN